MTDGISIRAYARQRGDITEAGVRKAISTGRITKGYVGGKIVPDIADRELAANTHAFSGWNGQARNMAKQDSGERVSNTFSQARAMREGYQARLARLEYEEKSGELIRKADVERDGFRIGRIVRDAMLAIPDRIAAELAGMTDPAVIHTRLTTEIRAAISELPGA